ncbi:MAG: metal ABC transporter permease [bacterium]
MFNNLNVDVALFVFFVNLSLITGVIGTIVVLKRMTSIAGSVSHSLLGSVALANYLKINPLLVSLPFVFLLSLIIHYIKQTKKVEEETALSIIWIIGVSLGIIIISLSKTYSSSLSFYLFGNVLFTDFYDVLFSSIFSLIALVLLYIFNREIKNVIIDEEYAKILGINVNVFNVSMLFLTSVSIVLIIKAVGIILLIAIFTIPATISVKNSDSIEKCILMTTFISLFSFISGYYLALWFDLPISSTITLLLLLILFFSQIIKNFKTLNFKTLPKIVL